MFDLTSEQRQIRMAARTFAEGEFKDIARDLDKEERFNDALWKMATSLGFLGVFIDEEYDGPGMGYLEQCLIMEEFSRVDLGIAQALDACFFGAQLIQLVGTDEQKRKYLPDIYGGKKRMGMAVTEPDAGSDVASATTTAVKENGEYILDGSKIFISNCDLADFLIVSCETDPDNEDRHKRLSTIIVETDREGFQANPFHGKLSIRASDTGEVSLNGVRVPEGNLLGQEGHGFSNVMECLNRARIQMAALGVGTAQGALEHTILHVRKRFQFNKPLASFQLVQGKIAEMATLVEAARSLCYRAAAKADSGSPDPALSFMAKMYCAKIALKVSDDAIQLHGGYGILEEYDVAHYWRDAKVLEIFGGAKEVAKIFIAGRLLGKY